MNAKQERRVAVYVALCTGHVLIVVFRGDAGIEHVLVSDRAGDDPKNVLARRRLLDEIWAITPLEQVQPRYRGLVSSLRDELDKLICREEVYRAR